MTVEQTNECYPLFLVVLETDNVCFQNFRADFHYVRLLADRYFLFLGFLGWNQDARTWSVTIYGTSLASRAPSFYVKAVYQLFIYIVRKVDGYTDWVVHPLLDSTLHLYLHQPIDIVWSSLVVRWLSYQVVDFFLSVTLFGVKTVGFHPSEELMMIYNVFFECVAGFIHEIHVYLWVVWIDLSSTLINRHKDWLNTRCSLCHQAGSSSWSNGQTSNVSTTVLLHFFVQGRISFLDAVDERIVLFTFPIVDGERTAFLSHIDRRTVCFQSYNLVYFFWECCRFFCSVTQAHSSNHIAFSSDTYTCTASLSALFVNLFPQMSFCPFNFFTFRVGLNLFHNLLDLFQLEVDDVIHDALCQANVLFE